MLKQDYTPPFLAYLTTQDEAGLRRAYELGRHAMRRSVGLLDLVRIHNEVFLEVIGTARTPESAQDVARAAWLLQGASGLVVLGADPIGPADPPRAVAELRDPYEGQA